MAAFGPEAEARWSPPLTRSFTNPHIVGVAAIASRCALPPEMGSEILAVPLVLRMALTRINSEGRKDDATRKSCSTSR